MGGFNKGVAEAVEKALRNGEGWKYTYHVDARGETVDLYHYGTLILSVDKATREIVTAGGYSMSDRDAIATALEVLHAQKQIVTRSPRRATALRAKEMKGNWYFGERWNRGDFAEGAEGIIND